MPTKSKHPGVKLIRKRRTLASGKTKTLLVVRYTDPITGKNIEKGLEANFGVSTKAAGLPFLLRLSDKIQAQKRSLNRRGIRGTQAMGFPALLEAYEQWLLKEKGEKSAHDNLVNHLSRFKLYLKANGFMPERGEAPMVLSLNESHLAAFRDTLSARLDGKPGETKGRHRNRQQDGVVALLTFAREKGCTTLSQEDVLRQLKKFKVEKPRPVALGQKEILALIEAAKLHDLKRAFKGQHTKPLFPWLFLSLMTGARPGEVLGLRWDRIDFERKYMLIRDSKRGVDRTFPLGDSPCFLRFLEEYPRHEALILGGGKTGKPLRTLTGRRHARLEQMAGNLLAGKPYDFEAKQEEEQPEPLKFVAYHLRSTAVSYFRQYARGYPHDHARYRFGHDNEVAFAHYVGLGAQIDDRGASIESWYGCEEAIEAALDRVLEHERKREFEARQ